jgi:hypothetical protein
MDKRQKASQLTFLSIQVSIYGGVISGEEGKLHPPALRQIHETICLARKLPVASPDFVQV